jgi:GPI-anchor transamidase subunit T
MTSTQSLTLPDNPIPRPPPGHELKCDATKAYHNDDTCFPADFELGQEWTLSQIFGKPMKGTCPLTDPEIPPVCIDVPHGRDVYTSGNAVEAKNKSGLSRCFKLDPVAEFEMVLPLPKQDAEGVGIVTDSLVETETPLLYAERSFTGYGQEHGGVQSILTNPSKDTEVEFVYMESLPWFMRVYLHTLTARVDGHSGAQPSIIQEIYYRPAVDRARGTQLELRMVIPPSSTVFLTYDFEKSILRYTEYPPDANRGFDVASAVITTLSPRSLNVRTTSLLLSLPTPDFSMPYNVIIFTSTAIALAFGGMYNILVRRFVGANEGPTPVLRAKLALLVERLKSRLGKK